jgi:hypothetical protein
LGFKTGDEPVLKITIDESAQERRWILQGRLVAVWVDELRKSWNGRPRSQKETPCVIDLNNVTFIDKRGEKLLRTMLKQGARFAAKGIYIRHVLEEVITNGKPHLSRLVLCLLASFAGAAICLFAPGAKADLGAANGLHGVVRRVIVTNGPKSGRSRETEGALRCSPQL